ncbi:uncharacterized protein LOC130896839 [Diorhabda carinulata]|uniref:uncharacterized protein LOC130449906 n=1 Tax=Diorhabda sublineata TaxID=1163346 RepID=UPI0024E0F31E|nr:uncharacterized protein LOC130449906 [Diorhabda sublineata]XP_057661154.1 uncharacterized protein LOC130896839 [Diorhabda carinulata]
MDNKAKVPPGWNDPPMLNYSASNPPPKSRITNKRIAFPLNSTSNNSGTALPKPLSNLPPMVTESVDKSISKEIIEQTLSRLLPSEENKHFHDIWNSDVPEEFVKEVHLMTNCLTKNDKEGAITHKKKLLSEYKSICDIWLKDFVF